jgi:hypothetical protein
MAFDIHLTIPEDSLAAQVVQRVVASEHITPEEAVTRILTEAAKLHGKKTPAEELIGAFSSPEDREVFDRAMESAKAYRAQFDRLRDFGFEE